MVSPLGTLDQEKKRTVEPVLRRVTVVRSSAAAPASHSISNFLGEITYVLACAVRRGGAHWF